MSEQYITMSSLTKELELSSGSNFQNILKVISSPVYLNEKLLKSELGLLNAKILKLLRSSNDHDVWKGCHTSAVICSYNPLFLLSYGGQSLNAVYAKLEQKSDYYSNTIATTQGRELLVTLISTTDILMDLMRSKPTLSRETLVPKLKAIIPTLIHLCGYEPKLCLPVLKKLLFKHSSTFKPFVNKYRATLTKLLTSNYEHLGPEVQKLLCNNYAYLYLIKLQSQQGQDENEMHHQIYADDTWRAGLFSILTQFKPIIKLCNNILDFDQDKELINFFDSLPSEKYKDYNIESFLSSLKLDMNEPFTLWEIPRRLNLLVDLLFAFVSQPTPFAIRVPIGSINAICEALLSVSTKYLPLRRELRRDQDLNTVIADILPQIQFSGISMWKKMIEIYGKSFLPMSDRILASLEAFIPFKTKSNLIDFEACDTLKNEFVEVFELSNLVLRNLGHKMNEVDSIMKLIDVALYLTEDKSLVDRIFNNQPIDTKDKINNGNKNKSKSKKDNKTGALSDLYTDYDKFATKKSMHWYNEINKFLTFIISNWRLSPSQQIRTIKYTVSKALQLKEYIGYIPKSFVNLLRILVINPGNERISILPIAVSLLKESSDELFDLLCHPRLPMSIIHNVKKPSVSEEEERNMADRIEEQDAINRNLLETSNVLNMAESDEQKINLLKPTEKSLNTANDESKIFKKRSVEEEESEESEDSSVKRARVDDKREELEAAQILMDEEIEKGLEPVVKKVEEQIIKQETKEENEEDDDSDFEIPDIHLSEYEDDEDEEGDK